MATGAPSLERSRGSGEPTQPYAWALARIWGVGVVVAWLAAACGLRSTSVSGSWINPNHRHKQGGVQRGVPRRFRNPPAARAPRSSAGRKCSPAWMLEASAKFKGSVPGTHRSSLDRAGRRAPAGPAAGLPRPRPAASAPSNTAHPDRSSAPRPQPQPLSPCGAYSHSGAGPLEALQRYSAADGRCSQGLVGPWA
jgi:hypothetical protein